MNEPHSAFSCALQPRAVLRTALRVAKFARLWESFEKGANLYSYRFPLVALDAELGIAAFEQIFAEFEIEVLISYRQKTSIQLDVDPVLCVDYPDTILLKSQPLMFAYYVSVHCVFWATLSYVVLV